MTSNAYLATDGEKLMKVGKANNPKRREKQIDLTTYSEYLQRSRPMFEVDPHNNLEK